MSAEALSADVARGHGQRTAEGQRTQQQAKNARKREKELARRRAAGEKEGAARAARPAGEQHGASGGSGENLADLDV